MVDDPIRRRRNNWFRGISSPARALRRSPPLSTGRSRRCGTARMLIRCGAQSNLMQVDELQATISRPLPSHREARYSPLSRRSAGWCCCKRCRQPTMKATVRIIEIAELVGVSHQRVNRSPTRPRSPVRFEREGQSRLWIGDGPTWAKVWRRWRRWVCGTVRHGCGPRRVLVPGPDAIPLLIAGSSGADDGFERRPPPWQWHGGCLMRRPVSPVPLSCAFLTLLSHPSHQIAGVDSISLVISLVLRPSPTYSRRQSDQRIMSLIRSQVDDLRRCTTNRSWHRPAPTGRTNTGSPHVHRGGRCEQRVSINDGKRPAPRRRRR